MESENQAYEKNSKFWTKKGDEPIIVGDFLGRLPSIKLIDSKKDEIILDAGCGAGFISRKIALSGARVFGCDRNKEMLEGAKKIESVKPLGIKYEFADIIKLPYNNDFFDKISCIAVLIHDSPEECKKFFGEAHRTLKKDGLLFISVMHPYLFQEDSPSRKKLTSWVHYEKLEEKPMSESQKFKEDYFNSKKEVFSSVVWYHPKEILLKLLKESGFEIVSMHEQFMTPEVLEKTNHKGPTGYPCFLQITAKKY